MDFENDGKTLTGIIICSVLIIVVIAFTFVMGNYNLKKSQNMSGGKEINNNSSVPDVKSLTESELDKLTDGFNKALYNYSQNYTGDLIGYLKGYSNSQKLYMGNIMSLGDVANKRLNLSDIQNRLKNVLGTDLDVLGEDYFLGLEKVPYYKYDAAGGFYTFNAAYDGGTDSFTDIGNMEIYNYKVKETKDNVIYVYGLYKNSTDFVPYLENGRGLTRYIGVDDRLAEFEYTETEAEFLKNLYEKEIEQFLTFEYHYKLDDNYYVLSDFKVQS